MTNQNLTHLVFDFCYSSFGSPIHRVWIATLHRYELSALCLVGALVVTIMIHELNVILCYV